MKSTFILYLYNNNNNNNNNNNIKIKKEEVFIKKLIYILEHVIML